MEGVTVCVYAQVPIMLRSSYCSLHGESGQSLQELGECPYDQAGSPICLLVLPNTLKPKGRSLHQQA